MAWYEKFLEAYDSPPENNSKELMNSISRKLSLLQSDTPLATISIIAYNEANRLTACLWSLSEMQCEYPVEIIGVNNNSSDQTEAVFCKLGIPYYNQDQKGPGFARQKGVDNAKGRFHICIDADTIYPPYFVQTHIEYLKKKSVTCAFSLWSFIPSQNYPIGGLQIYEAIRDLYINFQYIRRPELCVRGMTFSFHTQLGKEIGFRTDIKRGEDGSLALAMKKYGKIAFIRSRKARPVTGYGTLSADGALFNSFKIRMGKAFKSIPGLFIRKTHYKDEDSNIIKRENRKD